jgi:hypothetical protein
VIERLKGDHPEVCERHLCRMFSVSRSWYYEKPSPQQKARKDLDLRDAIEHIVLELPGYGYRRVTAELHRRGWTVNHKRVLSIMPQKSLLCHLKRRFRPTTARWSSSLPVRSLFALQSSLSSPVDDRRVPQDSHKWHCRTKA